MYVSVIFFFIVPFNQSHLERKWIDGQGGVISTQIGYWSSWSTIKKKNRQKIDICSQWRVGSDDVRMASTHLRLFRRYDDMFFFHRSLCSPYLVCMYLSPSIHLFITLYLYRARIFVSTGGASSVSVALTRVALSRTHDVLMTRRILFSLVS